VSDLIENALAVSEREGLPVFPLDRRKRPCWSNEELGVADGEGGYRIATKDPEEIRRLFSHKRAALIGVPTGIGTGLAVVDIDVKEGKSGQAWYDEHLADLGLTRWHRTKSGGVHLVYAINAVDPGCNAGVIHDGVDLRAGGGYIVWWPAHGCEFGAVELAPFPDWIAQENEEQVEAWATLAEDDLDQHILEAESFHQPMISLAWRMVSDGYSGRYIQDHLRDLFDRSVASDPKHPRHRDWTRRKLDIFRTVQSSVEKSGRADMPQQAEAKPGDADNVSIKPPAAPAIELPAISDFPGRRFDDKPAPELKTTIDGLVPAGRLCNVAGPGGAGKGILLQTVATCVSDGLPVLGRDTLKGAVAYYSCEDEDDVLHHRQARINELLGLPKTPDGLFIKSYLGCDLTMYDGRRWKPTFDWLWADLAKIEGLAVAVLDPASEFYIGEFADPVAVKAFCKALDAECVARGITLFLLMHTPKGDPSSAFGSVQWTNAARTTLVLAPAIDEDGAVDRTRAILKVAKGNYVRADDILLMWTDDGLLVPQHEPDAHQKIADAKDLDNVILRLVREYEANGAMISDSPQARDRYLPAKVRQECKSRFAKKEIIDRMQALLNNGTLKIGQHWKTRRTGLKVVEDEGK